MLLDEGGKLAMIETGTVLRLHNAGTHRVEKLYFKIAESGNWLAFVQVCDLETNIINEHPIFVIEELLNTSEMYLIGDEDIMKRFHEARGKRKNDQHKSDQG